jgi:hypothetical protein
MHFHGKKSRSPFDTSLRRLSGFGASATGRRFGADRYRTMNGMEFCDFLRTHQTWLTVLWVSLPEFGEVQIEV